MHTSDQLPLLVTFRGAAKLMGVSERQLRSIASEGFIIAVPVGKRWMVPREAIGEFIKRYAQHLSNDTREYALPVNKGPYEGGPIEARPRARTFRQLPKLKKLIA